MSQKRVAIACQGGGSQCAFVAGALKTLLAPSARSRFEVIGLSGTSGGALTAAVGWMGLLKQARGDRTPVEDGILAIWRDLSAQTPQERLVDALCVQLVRLTERGALPSLATSPSSPRFQLGVAALAHMLGRPEFTDLGALLRKHLDFAALPSLLRPDSPTLLVGAGDVLDGTFKVFSSVKDEIKVESLLASAAIPNLFPAVWVDGHAYWDGIFASNPPIFAFLQKAFAGLGHWPEEIWVIQVNRTRQDFVPELPSDIFDRRNQLAGNLSVQHELQMIEMVNLLLKERALSDEFRSRFGLEAVEPVKVRFIRMSDELMATLDYPTKLSRQPRHIERLIEEGETQATAFLGDLEPRERPRFGAPQVERPS